MTVALVKAGTVSDGSPTVSPAFGQATAAHNLLVACVVSNSNTAHTCSDGSWTLAVAVSRGNANASIWYKANSGASEVAPSFTGSNNLSAALSEWSGVSATPLDQTGSVTGIVTGQVVTAGAPDRTIHDLAIVCGAWRSNSTAVASTNSASWNVLANNDASVTALHLNSAYQVYVAQVTADTDTQGETIAVVTGAAVVIASFIPGAITVVSETIGSPGDTPARGTQISRSLSEAVSALADVANRLAALPRAVTQSIGALSDSLAGRKALGRNVSEALGAMSDTAGRGLQALLRLASDAQGALSETLHTTGFAFVRYATDTISALSEVSGPNTAFARSLSSSLAAVSDAAARTSIGLPRSAAEVITAMGDTAARGAQAFGRATSDSLAAMSDLAQRIRQSFLSAVDALSALSDTTLKGVGFIRLVGDGLASVVDVASRTFFLLRTAATSLQAVVDIADSNNRFIRALSDALGGITEAAARAPMAFVRTANISIVAIARGVMGLMATPAEPIGPLSETTASHSGAPRLAVDAFAGVLDVAVRSALHFFRFAPPGFSTMGLTRGTMTSAAPIPPEVPALSEVAQGRRGFGAVDALVGLTDSALRGAQNFIRALAIEAVGILSDQAARQAGKMRAAIESLPGLSELALGFRGTAVLAADAIQSLSDVARGVFGQYRAATDALGALTDAAVRAALALFRSVPEQLAALHDTTEDVTRLLIQLVFVMRSGAIRLALRSGAVSLLVRLGRVIFRFR